MVEGVHRKVNFVKLWLIYYIFQPLMYQIRFAQPELQKCGFLQKVACS